MANKVATREAYGKALLSLGAENPDVVVLDADLSKSTKTADFGKKISERFFNMGIAESNLMGTAAGLQLRAKFLLPVPSQFLPWGGPLNKSAIPLPIPSLMLKSPQLMPE